MIPTLQSFGQRGFLSSAWFRRTLSWSTGAMMAVGMAWLVTMLPPMTAPSSTHANPDMPVMLAKTELPPEVISALLDKTAFPSEAKPLDPIPVASTSGSVDAVAPEVKPSPPHESPLETLLLRVETRPPGATLFLDGKQLGMTPFTVGQISIGFHALRLEKKSFNPVNMNIELTEDTVVDLTMDGVEEEEGKGSSSEDKLSSATHMASEMPQAKAPPPNQETQSEQAKKVELPATPEAEATKTVKLPPAPEAESTKKAELSPAPEAKSTKKAEPDELKQKNNQKINTWLTLANLHFKENRLTKLKGQNALELYKNILTLDPQHQEAKQGIQRIITRLLKLGQEDLENWRLLRPQDNNALEKFRAVQTIEPNHPEAQSGLEEIVDRLLSLAQRFASDPLKAQEYLQHAETVLPGMPRIAATRDTLFPRPQPLLLHQGQ
ncbi:MAG: PEGA domain-containing protein [Magnetococcus sp. YQC-5]